MRIGTGLAGIGIVVGLLAVAACANDDPTGVRVGAELNYLVEELPAAEGDGGGEAGTQSDTITQKGGVGGFGSGN
jgi:hypothetical protein